MHVLQSGVVNLLQFLYSNFDTIVLSVLHGCVRVMSGKTSSVNGTYEYIHTHYHSTLCACMEEEAMTHYVDNQSPTPPQYTPYKVTYSQLLHKLLGGTGMLIDYLWIGLSYSNMS